MRSAMVSANKSALTLHRLKSALQRQQQQLATGMSTNRATRRQYTGL
jgi:hypothetical protein